MAEIEFDVDTSIYRENGGREYLLDSSEPRDIVGRDDVLNEYRNALLPVVNGEDPDDIFIYGKPGTGKTACTRFMTDTLTETIGEQNLNIDLKVTSINCESITSSYGLAIEIINTLRPMGEEMSESGHKPNVVYKTLFNELDEIGGTHLLVLDELDSLGDDLNGILYQIPRARTNGYLENAKVGIIGISNDLTLLDDLDRDVESSLADKRINFDPYDASELYDVLKQRAVDALYDDAYDESVLRLCAAFGAEHGGDARRAIELLRESADLARGEDGTDTVTRGHVERAKEKIRSKEVITSISSLSQNEKMTLYALVTLIAEGNNQPRSRDVYERYRDLAESAGERPVKYRTVRDYLSELDELQITHRDGENGGPDGNYRTHELNEQISIEEAVSELDGVISMCGVHESISHVTTTPNEL